MKELEMHEKMYDEKTRIVALDLAIALGHADERGTLEVAEKFYNFIVNKKPVVPETDRQNIVRANIFWIKELLALSDKLIGDCKELRGNYDPRGNVYVEYSQDIDRLEKIKLMIINEKRSVC